MSIFEQFAAFAEALPDDRRAEIADFLTSIMDADSPAFALTADELAEIDKRIGDSAHAPIDDATFRAKLRQFQN